MTSRKPSHRLFAWLFIAAGSLAFYFLTVVPLLSYWQSGQWQSVPATITHLELVSSTSDGSTTYRVDADYNYEFNGQSYRSDNVSLSSGSDNIGDYWQDLYRTLSKQRSYNEVTALVNPDNPHEALLDRTLRAGVLLMGSAFFIIFAGVGLAVMKKPIGTTSEAHQGDIYSDQKGGYRILLFIGLAFFTVGTVMCALILLSQPSLQPKELLILIFPSVGAALAWQALRMRKRFLSLGVTPLSLDPNPASANGHVAGSISISGTLEAPLTLTLQCIHRYTTGSGKEQKTEERVIWSDKSVSWPGPEPQQHCFVFQTEGRQATGNARRGSILWRLLAQGAVKNSNNQPAETLKRSWQIPVSEAHAVTSLTIPERLAQQVSSQFESHVAEDFAIQQQGQELYFVSAAGRNMGANIGLMLVGGVFLGSGIFLFSQAIREGGALWFMAPAFFSVGLIIVLSALWTMGRKLETWISPTGIRTLRSCFGKTLYQQNIHSVSPTQLEKKKTSSMQSGSEHKEFYKLYIKDGDKKLTLAESIESSNSADALLNRMRQALTGHLDDELGL